METPTDASTEAQTRFTAAQQVVLNRQVELEITLDQLWSLVSEPENLRDWLGDDIDLELRPGSGGTVVEEGVVRHVRVDRVVEGSRLEFTWWRSDEPYEVSAVVFQVEALPSGSSRLRISETLLGSAGATTNEMTASVRWEIRMLSLWACTVAMALVP